METTTSNPERQFSSEKLVFGLVLIVVGAIGFADAIDFWSPRHLWRYWPVILIALGLSSEVDALRARRSDGGSILIGIGVWLLAGNLRFFGLSYGYAFPLGIIVVGLFLTLHAIVDKPAPPKKENAR